MMSQDLPASSLLYFSHVRNHFLMYSICHTYESVVITDMSAFTLFKFSSFSEVLKLSNTNCGDSVKMKLKYNWNQLSNCVVLSFHVSVTLSVNVVLVFAA